MKTIVTTVVVTLLLCGLAALAFMYSGVYDVSAAVQHNRLSNWAMSTTMRASVERHAKNIVVPDLSDESLPLAGINDFEAMCAGCHGAPGKSPNAMGKGLNPPAPDLQQVAAHSTPAELFWVTKRGIKMTGMPAWGASHDDDALWPVVALMVQLPAMDGASYQELLRQAHGMGHHSNETDSPSTDDGADHHKSLDTHPINNPKDIQEAEHDHSSHEH